MSDGGYDWSRVRAQFPALRNWTYLNSATYGQLPKSAVEAGLWHYSHRDELACSDFLDWFDDMDRVRGLVGQLIHCEPDDVCFVSTASHALSIVFSGIDWKPGDRIVALEGEFPNNLYAPAVRATGGVEFVETSWQNFYDAAAGARLVLMSSANYITGFRPPLAEISRFLRTHGTLFYVDGTQSVGALRFDCAEVQPDFVAVHGYKWLLSPNGAGFFYVRPEVREWLPANVVGWRSDHRWRSVDDLHHGRPEFKHSAEKYEGGMLNFPVLYAMGASIDLMLEIGLERIEARVLDLARQAREILEAAGGHVLYDDTPILAARFYGRDASSIAKALRERRILVSARHGNLRVSTHFYNNEEDLDALRAALARVL